MSTQDPEQYRNILQQLEREDQRLTALNELKNLLEYKAPAEAVNLIKGAGISKIIHCLSDSDKEEFDITLEVLKICFEKFEPGDVIKCYTGNIMYMLRHEKSFVRRLAIIEVHRAVTADPALLPVPKYIDLFVAVAQLIIDNIGIGNKAVLITSNLPFEAYPKVLEEMKIALEYDVSSKCNAYEVVVNVSAKSFELLNLCNDKGYIDHMLSQLQTDDVVYQMNILQLLSRLTDEPHGMGLLMTHGALKKISDMIIDLPNNPLSNLLTPGYMKFIGSVAHYYPKEILDKYPAMMDMMLQTIESGNPNILPVTLDCFGFIGRPVEGKLCLIALGSKFTQAVEKVGQLVRNSPTETKISAINCFANLIAVGKLEDPNKHEPNFRRVTLMAREWFRSMSSQPSSMEVLFEICKNPFPDIKIAGLTLLCAVCQHQWGEELLIGTAGFMEYLLDRSNNIERESTEAKYDVIRRLATSTMFDDNIKARLQTYVEQGPFHPKTILEVAIEEGD